MPMAVVQAASELCAQYGAWLVVDNTYEHFAYDGAASRAVLRLRLSLDEETAQFCSELSFQMHFLRIGSELSFQPNFSEESFQTSKLAPVVHGFHEGTDRITIEQR
eukprot:3554535-Pleurochrysis_carterae.AAC.1